MQRDIDVLLPPLRMPNANADFQGPRFSGFAEKSL